MFITWADDGALCVVGALRVANTPYWLMFTWVDNGALRVDNAPNENNLWELRDVKWVL